MYFTHQVSRMSFEIPRLEELLVAILYIFKSDLIRHINTRNSNETKCGE